VIRGTGTALNVATVLLGSGIGVVVRDRLPERTREVITDGLGLVTLMIAVLSARDVVSPVFAHAVGSDATVLVVLGSIVLGGLVGSLLRLEQRLESFGAALQRRLVRNADAGRRRFVEGYVLASLVFVVGPLTILGSVADGLGQPIDLLALKSTLDGFASLAFAASYGWGVAAAAISVAVVQGALTVVGAVSGTFLSAAGLASLGATGGLLLGGVGLRLLGIKPVPVADLLPALVAAPCITAIVAALR
jgi:uncharacterized membrane protein YqgA involved in biofilm formation